MDSESKVSAPKIPKPILISNPYNILNLLNLILTLIRAKETGHLKLLSGVALIVIIGAYIDYPNE